MFSCTGLCSYKSLGIILMCALLFKTSGTWSAWERTSYRGWKIISQLEVCSAYSYSPAPAAGTLLKAVRRWGWALGAMLSPSHHSQSEAHTSSWGAKWFPFTSSATSDTNVSCPLAGNGILYHQRLRDDSAYLHPLLCRWRCRTHLVLWQIHALPDLGLRKCVDPRTSWYQEVALKTRIMGKTLIQDNWGDFLHLFKHNINIGLILTDLLYYG